MPTEESKRLRALIRSMISTNQLVVALLQATMRHALKDDELALAKSLMNNLNSQVNGAKTYLESDTTDPNLQKYVDYARVACSSIDWMTIPSNPFVMQGVDGGALIEALVWVSDDELIEHGSFEEQS